MAKGSRSRPVSRVLSPDVCRHRVGGHSSTLSVTGQLQRPTRGLDGPSLASPYLVLLRMGFSLPLSLPKARCALAAPFHPYQYRNRSRRAAVPADWRFVFCGTLPEVAPAGCYPASCPVEPGLSSRLKNQTGDRPACSGVWCWPLLAKLHLKRNRPAGQVLLRGMTVRYDAGGRKFGGIFAGMPPPGAFQSVPASCYR